MSADTVTVNVPRSVVETIQQGSSYRNYADSFSAVREAILAVDLPAPADPPGTTYVDPDGDLWIVGPNGKVGLVIIDADPDYGDQQTVHFTHAAFEWLNAEMEEDGWSVVYRPGGEVKEEEQEPRFVKDYEGDVWERMTSSGLYEFPGCLSRSFVELAKDFGPLEVLS